MTGGSPGLFLSFRLSSGLPSDPLFLLFFSSETSGDQGSPIQGGVELSSEPRRGTKQLSVESHFQHMLIPFCRLKIWPILKST